MAILLFNRTRVPNAPLRGVLTFAARKIGVKGDVVVVVTAGRWYGSRGVAHSGIVKLWHAKGGIRYKNRRTRKTIGDLGWFTISVPTYSRVVCRLASDCAQAFVKVALHEMSHVRDFRTMAPSSIEPFPADFNRRRPRHDKRVCELRAEDRMEEIIGRNRQRVDELAASLATALTETYCGGEK